MGQEPVIEDYKVDLINIEDIMLDEEQFNCRGEITHLSVIDLAESIKLNGLQTPVTVQPMSDVKNKDTSYKWRAIAGYRRIKACRIAGLTTIPAFIKTGLTDEDARIINFVENLDRQDLNIMQEAVAIKKFKDAGCRRDVLAKKLKKSVTWVQVREMLITMPEEVQKAAASGLINQYQLKDLNKFKNNPQKMLDIVKSIKEARERGDETPTIIERPVISESDTKRSRTKQEILALMFHLQATFGCGYWTRLLAWCAGTVTDAELSSDLRELGEIIGHKYYPPVSGR